MALQFLRALWSRLTAVARRRRLDRDLEDEMAFHLAMRAEQYRAAGLDAAQAQAAANQRFGNVLALREACRDLWTFPSLEQFAQDVRFGLRMLRRNRGFTSVTVLTLALAIGATTAVFALLDAALLRPLPVRDPERLVVPHWIAQVESVVAGMPSDGCGEPGDCSIPYPLYETMRDASSLSGFAAFSNTQAVQVRFQGESAFAPAQFVSGNFFSVLGLPPGQGRLLLADDDSGGGQPVVVLSAAYTRKRFGENAAVLGRSVEVNGTPLTIVGVTPPDFFGLDPTKLPALWMPLHVAARLKGTSAMFLAQDKLLDERALVLGTIGRLKADVAPDQARTELAQRFRQSVAASTTRVFKPDSPADVVLVSAERGMNVLYTSYASALGVLRGLVGVVLLVACANIANLLLVRALARRREIAVRLALGAGRGRLFAQLLTEGLLLSSLGAAAGLALGFWGSRLIAVLLVPEIQSGAFTWTGPSPTLFGITILVASATTVCFGLAPAWIAWRVAPATDLQSGGTAGQGLRLAGGRANSVARWIVAGEIGGALVLLVAAGLFVRSIVQVVTFDPGFQTQRLLTVAVEPVAGTSPGDVSAEIGAAHARLASLPGVEDATWSSEPLLGETTRFSGLMRGEGDQISVETVTSTLVGPHFFRTMGMPLLGGRDVDLRDCLENRPVVWLNHALAQARFPGGNPVGARVRPFDGEREVVGVVADARLGSIRAAVQPGVYVANRADARYLILRTSVRPLALVRAVEQVIHDAAPRLLARSFKDEDEHLQNGNGAARLLAAAALSFGGMALLLAAIGIYGVLSYSVSRRVGEIAIRVALGAVRADILRLVLSEVSRVMLVGTVLGALAAYWVTRSFTHFLFGVQPLDPWVYGAALLLVLGVAALASYLPANRASRVDPASALRTE